MKYTIALAALLSTASFAQEIPELSFKGIGTIGELGAPLLETCGTLAQDLQANIKGLFIKYNPFPLISDAAQSAAEMINQASLTQKDNVIPAVSGVSLSNPSESSLFTTVKSYIITRPYKMGVALITTTAALVGGVVFIRSNNK